LRPVYTAAEIRQRLGGSTDRSLKPMRFTIDRIDHIVLNVTGCSEGCF